MKLLYQSFLVLLVVKQASFDFLVDNEVEEFNKTNKLVVAEESEPCETACEKKKMYCNFDDYKSLSQEATNRLLEYVLIATTRLNITSKTRCLENGTKSIFSKRDDWSKQTANYPLPIYNTEYTCVFTYNRRNPSLDIPCDFNLGENNTIICSCRNQSLEYERENRIIISQKFNNCEKTCKKHNSICSFDAYSKLSQYEIRHLLKKAAISSKRWNASSSCSEAGNIFTRNSNKTKQFKSLPAYANPTKRCIYGFERNKYTPIPNCTNFDSSKYTYVLFCSCKMLAPTTTVVTTETTTIKTTPSTKSTTTTATTTTSTTAATIFKNPANATNSSAYAEQKRINDEYLANGRRLMYILLAVLVVVEVVLLVLLVRQIRILRKIERAEQDEIQLKKLAARRTSRARQKSLKNAKQDRWRRRSSSK